MICNQYVRGSKPCGSPLLNKINTNYFIKHNFSKNNEIKN